MSRLGVSNRISLPRKSAAPGGLAVGIWSALKRTGGLWFGWGGETVDNDPGEPDIHIRDGVTYATVDLRQREFEQYYNGYANEVLWPLFHYFLKGMRYNSEQRDAYDVNRTFGEAPACSSVTTSVHDYHLIPLARLLREAGVKRPIGFFLHIPFPNIEMLRVLPSYAELLHDMTSYDVVGFQTENDLRAFYSGIEHLFGADAIKADGRIRVGERSLRADVYPIGVDERCSRRGGDRNR
jgi:trehalose 6-phosphate synthase